MTILELATDLDLPRGGDPWHQLRNGEIPPNIISSLSPDLVDIIMRMIEPDHLKRATADQLLNLPKIKNLIRVRQRRISYSNVVTSIKKLYNNVYQTTAAFCYYVLYPLFKINDYINYGINNFFKKLTYNKNSSNVDNNNYDNNNNDISHNKSIDIQTTSTPKKHEFIDTLPLAMMHDDEEPSNEKEHSKYCHFIK